MGLVPDSLHQPSSHTSPDGLVSHCASAVRPPPANRRRPCGWSSRPSCWTYSHHSQIADKNPSKRWNGGFRGFRICDGWISTTGFVLWVFMCPINFILFCPLFCLFFLCVFSGYHAKGYHAPSLLHGLSRPELSRVYHHCTATTPMYTYPGYHAIVLSSIPGLSHLSYHAPPHTYIGLSHPQ